jgi:hypothetical protein
LSIFEFLEFKFLATHEAEPESSSIAPFSQGRFAAWKQPKLFSEEVRADFGSLRLGSS